MHDLIQNKQYRVDKNRLLLVSIINILTACCFVFSMSFYQWTHITLQRTQTRKLPLTQSTLATTRSRSGPTFSTQVFNNNPTIYPTTQLSKKFVLTMIAFVRLFLFSLTSLANFVLGSLLSHFLYRFMMW